MTQATIEYRAGSDLRPYGSNARTHSKKQIKQIAASIRRFGFTNPVLISDDDEIIAGHGRVLAAVELGLGEVPTLRLSHLGAAERRAYVLADNKLALNAGWDQEILAIELQALIDFGFDVEATGFSLAEVDFVLDAASEASVASKSVPEDETPALPDVATSRRGDVWLLGRHKLICGDARNPSDYDRLLGETQVDLMFTDPPTTCQLTAMSAALARPSTASLRWPRAKCRPASSPRSCE